MIRALVVLLALIIELTGINVCCRLTRTYMRSILIAEDNEDLRKMLAWLLQPRGYETLQAATGKEAIQVAIAAQPNLILLDLNLPDMTGRTLRGR